MRRKNTDPWRKVVRRELLPMAMLRDVLECGHKITRLLSTKDAQRRRCHFCASAQLGERRVPVIRL